MDVLYALHRALDQKFGRDILLLDIRGLTVIADYFVLVTGGSAPQVQALADAARDTLAKHGVPLRHSEGERQAAWVLLDFGDIIVHVFDKESRAFYSLERVWGDAKRVELPAAADGQPG